MIAMSWGEMCALMALATLLAINGTGCSERPTEQPGEPDLPGKPDAVTPDAGPDAGISETNWRIEPADAGVAELLIEAATADPHVMILDRHLFENDNVVSGQYEAYSILDNDVLVSYGLVKNYHGLRDEVRLFFLISPDDNRRLLAAVYLFDPYLGVLEAHTVNNDGQVEIYNSGNDGQVLRGSSIAVPKGSGDPVCRGNYPSGDVLPTDCVECGDTCVAKAGLVCGIAGTLACSPAGGYSVGCGIASDLACYLLTSAENCRSGLGCRHLCVPCECSDGNLEPGCSCENDPYAPGCRCLGGIPFPGCACGTHPESPGCRCDEDPNAPGCSCPTPKHPGCNCVNDPFGPGCQCHVEPRLPGCECGMNPNAPGCECHIYPNGPGCNCSTSSTRVGCACHIDPDAPGCNCPNGPGCGCYKNPDPNCDPNAPCNPEVVPGCIPPPPPACQGKEGGECGDGHNVGDPHLITLDGLKYDFQAVGEFVLLQSDTGDMVIQTRQVPWGASRLVAVNKAVAMNVNGDIVGIYDGQSPPLYVNGSPTLVPGLPLELAGGGRVYLFDGRYTVVWPDSSQVTVGFGRFGGVPYLDIKVSISPERVGHVSGLLGNYDGASSNDLVTRDGIALDRHPSFEQLYGQFAQSWRISQAESLFFYGAGEDTGTFTDATFPDQLVTSDTLEPTVRTQAEDTCTNAGITDPALLDACIVDVGVTGETSFADSVASADPPAEVVLVNGRYFNDFEGPVGSEWSSTSTAVTPIGARRFLGRFHNENVSISLDGLPAHNMVTVSFDLFTNLSWDGNHTSYGPDVWRAEVRDGQVLLNTTFTTYDVNRQAFPDPYPGGDNPAFTGASEVRTLGYTFGGTPVDAVYRLSFAFTHENDSLILDFHGVGLTSDEDWGLDNFEVVLDISSESTLATLDKGN